MGVTNGGPTELEKQNLEAHVYANNQRFANIDAGFERVEKRLEKMETKMDTLHEEIKAAKYSNMKAIIGLIGTVVAGLISTIIVLLYQM